MSREIILQLKDLCLTRGAKPLFSGVELSVLGRDRIALVGPNGVGKSTLFQVISGTLEFDKGERVLAKNAHVAIQSQEPDFSDFSSLIDFAKADIPFEGDDKSDGQRRAAALRELSAFGLEPEKEIKKLSGGEARRAGLARVFASDADLILLDEPTNHLDIKAIEDLEARILSHKGAILMISHDRKFLENVSNSCVWLRNGKTKKLNSGFKKFDTWSEQIEEQEGKALEKLDLRLKDEAHWLARGVTARRSRNQGRLKRLYEMREQRVQVLASLKGEAATLRTGSEASSKLMVEVKGITKSFPNRGTIIDNLDLRILRGDRIGIVGPNGIGKSTLVKMIVGEISPDLGNIRRAKNQSLAYLDQTRASLDNNATLWETFAPMGGDQIMVQNTPRHVVAYGKDFLFSAAQMRQPIGSMSGGERNRVLLALALAKPCNLLVLDEPTNDLDMDTLDVLEEMLANFDGTIILVSHDRAFLDNVVTSTLAPVGNGKWRETPGGWSEIIAQNTMHSDASEKSQSQKTGQKNGQQVRKEQNKLSFKEAYRLEELPKLIADIEEKIKANENALDNVNLYLDEPKKFEKISSELIEQKLNLENYETEWLVLEEKKSLLES